MTTDFFFFILFFFFSITLQKGISHQWTVVPLFWVFFLWDKDFLCNNITIMELTLGLTHILKCEWKFILTYNSKVSVGLQHHIFVEILLGSIQQTPFFPSEVNMHVIICHCILKYPNMCTTKCMILTTL